MHQRLVVGQGPPCSAITSPLTDPTDTTRLPISFDKKGSGHNVHNIAYK